MVDGINKGNHHIYTFQDYLNAKEKYVYNKSPITPILLNKLPLSWTSFANIL